MNALSNERDEKFIGRKEELEETVWELFYY